MVQRYRGGAEILSRRLWHTDSVRETCKNDRGDSHCYVRGAGKHGEFNTGVYQGEPTIYRDNYNIYYICSVQSLRKFLAENYFLTVE